MKNKISNYIWNIIACGFPRNDDIEILRKVILIKLFSILGCIFLFSFGLVAILEKKVFLFLMDYSVGIFLILFLLWMKKTQNIIQAGYIATSVLSLFYLFLIALGGVNQTAYLWSFTFPIFTIFILGNRKGTVICSIFILSVVCIFICGHHISYISKYSIDLIIRFIAVFILITIFVFLMEKIRKKIQQTLIEANMNLQKSLEEVNVLSGLLPICSKCKKIRDDSGYWNQIERYISKHSEAKFSHSMCPECSDEYYGNDEWYKKMKIRKKQKE